MHLPGRHAEYQARDILQGEGYEVGRTLGAYCPVDMVAWDRNGILLLRVRRSRKPLVTAGSVLAAYREEIETLRWLARPPHSRVQLWICTAARGWNVYDVYPGGIQGADT